MYVQQHTAFSSLYRLTKVTQKEEESYFINLLILLIYYKQTRLLVSLKSDVQNKPAITTYDHRFPVILDSSHFKLPDDTTFIIQWIQFNVEYNIGGKAP